MSLEPTPDEAAAFTNVGDVAAWAGLTGDSADEASPLGSFLQLLGVLLATHYRVLGALSEADFSAVLAVWKVSGSAPTPGVR